MLDASHHHAQEVPVSAVLPGVPFVGRAREIASLTSRLEDAIAGQGGIAVVAGEAGIGKTRVAEELAAVAERQGARVMWGRCVELEGAPAFWPWIELLRAWVQSMGADAGPMSADVAQLIPELRPLFPDVQ